MSPNATMAKTQDKDKQAAMSKLIQSAKTTEDKENLNLALQYLAELNRPKPRILSPEACGWVEPWYVTNQWAKNTQLVSNSDGSSTLKNCGYYTTISNNTPTTSQPSQPWQPTLAPVGPYFAEIFVSKDEASRNGWPTRDEGQLAVAIPKFDKPKKAPVKRLHASKGFNKRRWHKRF